MNRTPLILALVLLLLPVLYVGSYLALVDPPQTRQERVKRILAGRRNLDYRFGGEITETFFYPLQKLDRKLRPGVWERSLFE